MALVTFLAASSIFTSPHPQGYEFSSSQYGGDVPAVGCPSHPDFKPGANIGPALALECVFLLGLGSNLVSMTLLTFS